jgi:hypothetical protein
MHAAVRPYVTAGAALVGASVIAVTPIAPPPPPDIQVANPAVRLAARSIANVPLNLFYAIANIPANEVQALNNWSEALAGGGSWWLKTPTNVWGWDPGNPPMLQALVSVLVPFPAISGNGGLPDVEPGEHITHENSVLGGTAPPGTLGYMLNVLVAAWAPMHEDCGFTCSDVLGALSGYFQVPLSELMAGYTFPEVENPNENPGEPYPPAWSGQQAEPLDPVEPIRLFIDSLMEDPPESGIKTVSLRDVVTTATDLYTSGMVAFNPYFPGSYLFTGAPRLWDAGIFVGGLVNGIVSRICPSCVPDASASVTSIPSPRNSGQAITIDVASIAPDGDAGPNSIAPHGDAGQNVVTGEEVQSPKGRQDIPAGASIARQAASTAADVFDNTASSQTLAPEARQGLHKPSTPVEKPEPTITTSTIMTNGNKVEPGQVADKGTTSRERLSGAVKSVSDRISSAISKATEGLKGGGTNTGEAESDKAGTDGTSKQGPD